MRAWYMDALRNPMLKELYTSGGEKMKKKLLALLMATTMSMALVACGGSEVAEVVEEATEEVAGDYTEEQQAFVDEYLQLCDDYDAAIAVLESVPELAENQELADVMNTLTDAIAEAKVPALDLASNYKEIGAKIVEVSQPEFKNMGLKLCKVTVENLSLPEEVEKVLDERSKLGILGDKMGTYAQYQSAQAIRDAANNPSGGNMAGIGVGFGAGKI